MSDKNVFDIELSLPNAKLSSKEATLLGFDVRYARASNQLRLLLEQSQLIAWNKKFHGGQLALTELVAEQYPFIIFHGDVGTGKTATAECIANRLIRESKQEDCVLFKLSNRVRGSGMVGEMGTLLVEAFQKVTAAAGKSRRCILLIDEGDSLAASRAQAQSHHEDKVAVNTLIQGIDDLRRLQGRVLVILCTNRSSALDPALLRRAALIEEFRRPDDKELRRLFEMDLGALKPTSPQLTRLVQLASAREGRPAWTYSDIRTRLYPAALSAAFPASALSFEHLIAAAETIFPSPVVENR